MGKSKEGIRGNYIVSRDSSGPTCELYASIVAPEPRIGGMIALQSNPQTSFIIKDLSINCSWKYTTESAYQYTTIKHINYYKLKHHSQISVGLS